METVIMTALAIILALDVLTNLFMLLFSPKWSAVKREELDAMREHTAEMAKQNKQLIEYIKYLEEG